MNTDHLVHHHDSHHHSLVMYIVGFVFSVGLTLAAFLIVAGHVLGRKEAVFAIMALSILQLVVQSIFFLHIGSEPKKEGRWNISIFFFAILVVTTLVLGSLWIMRNLNYSMQMSPQDTNTYMLKSEHVGLPLAQ